MLTFTRRVNTPRRTCVHVEHTIFVWIKHAVLTRSGFIKRNPFVQLKGIFKRKQLYNMMKYSLYLYYMYWKSLNTVLVMCLNTEERALQHNYSSHQFMLIYHKLATAEFSSTTTLAIILISQIGHIKQSVQLHMPCRGTIYNYDLYNYNFALSLDFLGLSNLLLL